MLHRLKGVGLSNVYLSGGVAVTGEGENQRISYAQLDGLFHCIALAIATRKAPLVASELRFLRKRLGFTQEQVGALGEKTAQAVAKWEKGALPVPSAESNLLRLAWLNKFARRSVSTLLHLLTDDRGSPTTPYRYVFVFDGSKWTQDDDAAEAVAHKESQAPAVDAIHKAMEQARTTSSTTISEGASVRLRGISHTDCKV